MAKHSVRRQGSNTRYVCDILPQADRQISLGGSGYARRPFFKLSATKHDTDNLPQEFARRDLLPSPQSAARFAFQRVYTDDRSLDESMAVENHDVVMVPRGYHPVVAPHGFDSYYLNVMAGPGVNGISERSGMNGCCSVDRSGPGRHQAW